MSRSGFFRQIVGGLLALGVLAALVSPTAASPIVRKARAVVDAASVAGTTTAFLRTDDGASAPLWIDEAAGPDTNDRQLAGFSRETHTARALALLEHSAFGSRPPPVQA